MLLRRAQSADLDTLVRFEQLFPSDRLSRASFRRLLHRGRADIWVQENKGAIVGNAVALYRRGVKVARVYSLVVHPDHQRRGFARALMLCVEKSAHQRGCREIRLEVRPDNASAISFYEKIGYRIMKRVEKYYQDGTDALRTMTTLPSDPLVIVNVPAS